jgi:hypothetical protein
VAAAFVAAAFVAAAFVAAWGDFVAWAGVAVLAGAEA